MTTPALKKIAVMGLSLLLGGGSLSPVRADVEIVDSRALDHGARLKHPLPMCMDMDSNCLYVGGYDSHNIVAWDAKNRKTVNEATGFYYPRHLTFDHSYKRVYALAYDEYMQSALWGFDKNLKTIRKVPLEWEAYALALRRDGTRGYVGTYKKVVTVDVLTGVAEDLVDFGWNNYCFAVALDEGRNQLYIVVVGWVYENSVWKMRSFLHVYDLALRAIKSSLVLGDGLFSYDIVQVDDDLYIANTDGNSVYVVNIDQMQIVERIEGVSWAQKLVYHRKKHRIYVVDNYSDKFHVICCKLKKLLKTITPGDDPSWVLIGPDDKLYTANYWSNDFSIIDDEKEEISDRIGMVAARPNSFFLVPELRKMYVTNGSSNGILVIGVETGNVVDHLTMPDGVFGGALCVNPDLNKVFVCDAWRHGVAVYPMASADDQGVTTSHHEKGFIALPGQNPSGISRWSNDRVCVTFVDGGQLKLSVVDGKKETIDRTITLGTGSQVGAVVVSEKKDRAYVADTGGNRLIAVDLKKGEVCGTVALESYPTSLTLEPVSGRIYIANGKSNSVAVVQDDPLETLGYIDVGAEPSGISIQPERNRLYVVNAGDGTLSVVNLETHQVVGTHAVGGGCKAVAAIPNTDRILIGSQTSGRLLTVRDTIRPSSQPLSNTLDASFRLGEVYSYPNPAREQNPVIHAEVGVADQVTFNVFDVAGTLLDEVVLKDPSVVDGKYAYEFVWDASRKAPGVYIVSMNARKAGEKNLRKTFKMAVIK
ncbi:MAG TPA: hypothetical protein PK876_09695 [Elusimicrobiota bacterium]|nr:hypothetical protein [Elusimicrobiota bacterium]